MTTSSSNRPAKASQATLANEKDVSAVAWLPMLTRWNMEIMSLYGKRMHEWSVLPFRVMQCTSPEDFTSAQDEFCQTLSTDYRAAAKKLAVAAGVNGSTSKERDSEAYAAILLKAQEDARNILDQARAQAARIIEEARTRNVAPKVAGEKTRVA